MLEQKNKIIIFYCTIGVRSGILATQAGKYHNNVHYLKGWTNFLEEYWKGDVYVYGMKNTKILNLKEVQKYLEQNIILVDPRRKAIFEKNIFRELLIFQFLK